MKLYEIISPLAEASANKDEMLWSVDLEYRLLACNESARRGITSLREGPIEPGMLPEELLPAEVAAIWPPLYQRALTQGAFLVHCELPEQRIVEFRIEPLLAPSPILGVQVRGRDVTRELQTAESQRSITASYQSVLDNTPAPIFRLNPDRTVLDLNPAMARVLGFQDPQEAVEFYQNPENCFWIQDSGYEQVWKQMQATGLPLIFSCHMPPKNGDPFWVSLHLRQVLNPSRVHVFYEGIVEDVSARQKFMESLEAQATQQKRVFQDSNSILLLIHPDSGEIVDANQTASDFYGYPREVLVGMHMSAINLLSPEEVRAVQHLARKSESRHLDFTHRLANGEMRDVEVYTSPFQHNDRSVLLLTIYDVSTRKRAQEELRESEIRYRTAFQTSLDAMAITRIEDGLIIDVNQACLDLFGYPRQELIGTTVMQNGIWDLADEHQKMRSLVLEQGGFREKEAHFRRKDGSGFLALHSATPLELGGEACVLSVLRDITARKAAEEKLQQTTSALRSSELLYRTLFETCMDVMSLTRIDTGAYLEVNRAFEETSGWKREEVLGKSSADINIWVKDGDRDRFFAALRNEKQCHSFECQMRIRSGDVRWVRISASIVEIDSTPCILALTRNIDQSKAIEAERARAVEALRLSEVRYRGAFQTSLDAFMLSNLETGQFFDINPSFLEMLGYEREELLNHTSIELNIWKDSQDRQRLVAALQQGESCRELEFEWRKKDGALFWVLLSATRMEVEGQPGLLAVVRDISAARSAAEEIRSLAFYDPLTHLPNRRLLLDRLQQFQAISHRSGHNSALLFIDLDNFKTLNDTLGHHIGDMLLVEVARRMVDCVRKSDTVGRLGGDEFIAMLEDLSKCEEDAASQARHVAEKILTAFDRPFQLGKHQYRCSASIGITIFGKDDESADVVLRQADIAMYQAKSEGRGSLHFFAPVLQAAVHTRAALEEDLRQAITQKQFELYYQPQLGHSHLISCEALVRWNHPTRGLLAPGEFIALAEETGLILSLGNWVLASACDQLALWGRNPETAYLSISVNISAVQFRQPGFVNRVMEELRRSGARPTQLCLELTESTLLDSVDETILRIAELKAHGVRFALDDFGTGYSSLSYLKRLPLDQLKIDRSFIQDILMNASSGAIVQTIVALGRAIGLEVIAEGVETKSQRDFLARLGCHGFQGYLFSPPQKIEDFETMWLNHAPATS